MEKFHIYHRYLRKKGIYHFGLKSFFKLLVFIAILAVAVFILGSYFKEFEQNTLFLLRKLQPLFVLSLFFVSESFLGLIPPDFFIVWGDKFSHPWLMLMVLASISYIGGIISYKLGFWLQKMPKFHSYLHKKFEPQLQQIRRYGAFVVIFAALFPLPYSAVCVAAGMVEYPFKKFVWLGLFRFIRFALHAIILFKLF